jgi:hypothetical protein
MKTSVIKTSSYHKPWEGTNGTVHYYNVVMENGDSGKIGVKDTTNPRVAVGSKIDYTINGDRISVDRLHTSEANVQTATPATPQQQSAVSPVSKPTATNSHTVKAPQAPSTPKKETVKNQQDYLGYIFGYAKDITVAQIMAGNSKVVADPAKYTEALVDKFYKKIGDVLNPQEQAAKPNKKTKTE